MLVSGGKDRDFLNVCEKYMIRKSKWEIVAPLNEARMGVTGVVLQSLTAFCFGGFTENKIRSLEKIDLLSHS